MKNKYRLWIIFSFIVVFAAGIIGGIFIDRYIAVKKPKLVKPERAKKKRVHFPSLEIMAEELQLSAEQQEKIKQIFRNNEESFKKLRAQISDRLSEMRKKLNREIENVLDPEQKKKFKEMIENYISRRKKEMEERERLREKHRREKEQGGFR